MSFLDIFKSCDEPRDTIALLKSIDRKQTLILKELHRMALDLTALTAEVAELETVEASAVALIVKLAEEIKANSDNPAEVSALADRLHAASTALGDAVAANTPAV